GLDYDDASDYSRAALAALEYEKPREKDGKVSPYGNDNLEASLCVQCGGEYDNDMGTQTDERHIRHESDYAKSGGVAEKIKNVVKAGAEAVSGKNKSCQAGKVWIAPVWQLKAAAAFEKRIGDFEPGCYGEMEFAAYYAMNMIAQNVMRKPRDKEHIKGCLMKYMEFREEGRKVFFKKLSESK
nr:hypothetical protein [bacterium]